MAPAVEPSDQRRPLYRHSPGERWWFALLVVPVLLTGAVVQTRGHAIEDQLQHKALSALRAEGLPGTKVTVAGRKATLRVPTGESESKAEQVVASVDGIGGVQVEHVARTKAEERACSDLAARLDDLGGGHGILFSGRSASMTSAGSAAVRSAVTVLQRCPAARVTVEGYADSTIIGGSTLSLRRAQVVKAALVKKGIKSSRLDAQGFGDSFPASTNDTAQGRALNNRVELSGSDE
jgi:outer membrane protein OmpA-like peptidoglycan-associated protein